MKQNSESKTVAAVDLEVSGAGELMKIIKKLVKRMDEMNMEYEGLELYLNLKKYDGCVHSGFGM